MMGEYIAICPQADGFFYKMAGQRKKLSGDSRQLLVFIINLLFNASKPSDKKLRHH